MASLTMLAEMMATDTEGAVRRLREVDIVSLDLKGHVFGRSIEDLDDLRRERLAQLLDETGTSIHCLSTSLGAYDIHVVGEKEFRTRLGHGVANIVTTLGYVEAQLVRLFGCALRNDQHRPDEAADLLPAWVYESYRDAGSAIAHAGATLTLENEPDSVLSDPSAAVRFFERLDAPDVGFTWDIQNMWCAGTYPSVEVYEQLWEFMNYVHVKGGRSTAAAPQQLVYRSDLEHATWPVEELVGRVIADGVSPIVCINSPGGEVPPDYEHGSLANRRAMCVSEAIADVSYLRRTFPDLRGGAA